MGQKVNPIVMRLGMSQQWLSKWFSDRDYSVLLEQDVKIRRYIRIKLAESGIDRIEIERSPGKMTINLRVARPGLVIGRGGAGIEELRQAIVKQFMQSKKLDLKINIQEVDSPNLSAGVVLQTMISDLEKRMPFRRVLKQTLDKTMKAGAQGAKVMVSGRLNGAEIARTETLTQGKVPLHTLRADIDYSRGAARTTYGAIGVKVWIYKGLYFEKEAADTNKKKQP